MPVAPFVDSVFHPTDFTESSHAAFMHALAITLYRQISLTVMHVAPGGGDWRASPRVRDTLERWGLIEPGSARADVYDKLAIRIKKVGVRSSDPLQAIVDHLDRSPSDIVVLATEGRAGLPRWLRPSVAEGVARRTRAMTLFVPNGARGFVSPSSGEIGIRKILIPVDHRPGPGAAIDYAARAAVMSVEDPVEAVLFRVGPSADWPEMSLPELETCTWSRLHRDGKVVDGIVGAAEECSADLIVMATEGTRGILDALRGSVTEQVVRQAPCPVLAVPA